MIFNRRRFERHGFPVFDVCQILLVSAQLLDELTDFGLDRVVHLRHGLQRLGDAARVDFVLFQKS